MVEISKQQWQICLDVLQKVSEDTDIANNQPRFKALVAKIHKTGKKRLKLFGRENLVQQDLAAIAPLGQKRQQQPKREILKQQDLSKIAQTGRVKLEQNSEQTETVNGKKLRLNKAKSCYICKVSYHDLDHFYHMLCPTCAELNHQKRNQTVDLSGKTAIVTGGRIKIGYELVLKLLRDGANVLATTRFAVDALERIAKEPDFTDFSDRIHFYGLDLRHLPSVEAFINYVNQAHPHIDILVNNAAQTIRRPANFYFALYDKENHLAQLPELLQKRLIAQNQTEEITHYLEWADKDYFPAGETDRFLQPLDKRPKNSWVTTLSEVSRVEFVEAQVINYFAPYLLTSGLKPCLERAPSSAKFVVNVSAMEGQFARKSKTHFHPHTNMAKAALNMMTRTSAADYAQSHIYMNSVDTGWVTQENPYPKAQRIIENGFVPPLDEIDGAARIYDPIVQGIEGAPIYGHFLKDYNPFAW